jgi:hypothetical protein
MIQFFPFVSPLAQPRPWVGEIIELEPEQLCHVEQDLASSIQVRLNCE